MDLFKPNVNKMQKKKNVRGLIKALSYKDEQVRRKAAYALGSLGDARAASALLAALPDKSTFGSVAYALAKLKEPRLFDLLLPALNDDTLCSEAADALGILGDLRAVEPLIGLLKRQDTETRYSAVVALSNLHDPHASGALWEALNDADGHVRATAIDGLCELPDRLDKETLVRLLHDPDIVVRGKAAWNLDVKQIGIPEDPVEQAWYAAGRQNWDMAVKLGLIATEPLLLATQTEDMEERVGAAIALAKLGDRRAVEPLISTLTSPYYRTEVCKKVHIQAFEALGKYGDLRAVKPLQQYAQQSMVTEPSERSVAWRALSALESRLNWIYTHPPVCSSCGESIPALKSTITDDIRAGGGIVIGAGLDQKQYEGVICRTCGRDFCVKCHDPGEKGYNCPVCKQGLSPLFADYLLG